MISLLESQFKVKESDFIVIKDIRTHRIRLWNLYKKRRASMVVEIEA